MLNTINTEDGIPEREEIDQVRRLLFGEMQEANKRRMDALEAALNETRAALERQIASLGASTSVSQANFIKEIGEAISSLGQRIAGLADSKTSVPLAQAPAKEDPASASTTMSEYPAMAAHNGVDSEEASNASSAAASAQDHD